MLTSGLRTILVEFLYDFPGHRDIFAVSNKSLCGDAIFNTIRNARKEIEFTGRDLTVRRQTKDPTPFLGARRQAMVEVAQRQPKILLETGTNELEIIAFSLQWMDQDANEVKKTVYGINAAKVMELVAMPPKITEIFDSSHSCVKGVFLLRNRTIPLVDLSEWFGYTADPAAEVRAKWTVIVTELNGKPFGFISHGVDKVYRVSWDKIKAPPEIIASAGSITGICLIENQMIQMVDFESIAAIIDPSSGALKNLQETAIPEQMLTDNAGKNIVVVDDSKTIRMQACGLLEAAGFTVTAFADGQSAWDYLEKIAADGKEGVSKAIYAIVSDIEMPRMDGHHLCSRIKNNQALGHLPVVLFSSMINPALKRKGDAVGADKQITKTQTIELPAILSALHRKD